MPEPNAYSATWHAVFGATQSDETTAREIAFLSRLLPLPEHRDVLDVCCGAGRHLVGLSALGYVVTGIERDPTVAQAARESAPEARVVEGDADRLSELVEGPYDGIVCLWSSFGYGSPAANVELLRAMSGVLPEEGRLVLDVYNKAFFAARTGIRTIERAGRSVVERTALEGDRLMTSLDYGSGVEDVFSWQVFTPDELGQVARPTGLDVRLACAEFHEETPASSEHARMQLVLERGQTRGV